MTQTPQISQTGADDVRLMCLATHHKGGTVWMKSIIQALSAAWNIPMIGIWSDRQLSKTPQTGRAFLVNWPYDHPHSVTVTYEDLMADHHGVTFRKAMAHWRLSAAEQDHAAQVFWDNSLFGGLTHDDARSDHVQTGTTQKWRDDLPYSVGQVYAKEFGQDLIALGYE
ncbi:MAG: hypothetical protein EBU18_12260, partial [Rhodobacteraceae bacterium]|nr:hypothetical protein [Paracoccaceae bacterium]